METLAGLLNTIFSEEGIVALVLIVVLAILCIVAYALLMLVRQKNLDGATVQTQATVIAQLVKQIDGIADKLRTVADANTATSGNLVRVVELITTHDKRAADMHDLLVGAITEMQASTRKRDDVINDLPRRVREEMTPDLERLPKAIEEALEPTITAFQTDLEAVIAKLETALAQRIDAATENIPARTESMVQSELETLRGMIKQGFQDVLTAVANIKIEAEEDT